MDHCIEKTLYEPLSEIDRRIALEKAGVSVRDPSLHPGLSQQLDPTRGLDPSFRPIGYDTRYTTGVMVRCAICAQHQEHFDGAIVGLLDGKIGLVGNNCGKRHFFGNDGWSAITNKIRRDEEQAIFSARFGPAKTQLIIVDKLLAEWRDKLRSVEVVYDHFKAELPQLFVAIRKQVKTGGLSVDEVRQVPFRLLNGDIEIRSESHQRTVCQLEADWFFFQERLTKTVDQLRPQIKESFDRLDADATSQNVTAVKRLMRQCYDSLLIVAEKQSKLKSLSTEMTIGKIAEWGNHAQISKDNYRVEGKALLRVRNEVVQGSVDFRTLPSSVEWYWDEVKKNWPSF